MVATTLEHFGPVDVLVNNAAITFPGDLDLEMKRFDLVMQVDLRAPLHRDPGRAAVDEGHGGAARSSTSRRSRASTTSPA